MAEHNIFLGGEAPATVTQLREMLPSTEPDQKDAKVEAAAHKGPVRFSLTRRMDFLGMKAPKGKNPQFVSGGQFPAPVWNQKEQDYGSQALEQYWRTNTLALGDVLNFMIIPNRTYSDYVRVEVCRKVPGLTFDLDIRNGTVGTNTPIVLATGASVLDAGDDTLNKIIDISPRWYSGENNDMLRLTVASLPTDPDTLPELCMDFGLVLDAPVGGFY